MKIHPTAVIASGAEIDTDVVIGPYTVIEKDVIIGSGTEIGPNTFIEGVTSIGKNNKIGAFASIGTPPQDLRYNNEPTKLNIGDDNIIREYTSIHRGTVGGGGVTTIGNGNMIMAYSHIAHDCTLGNKIIMANTTTLGGHVQIMDFANLGGMVGIHQFTRVGEHCYIGGMSGVSKDVPPFIIASGVRSKMKISGVNKIGLKRCGYDNEIIKQVNKAFVYIFKSQELLLNDALDKCSSEFPDCEPVIKLVEFFKAPNRLGVLRKTNGE